MSTLMQLFFCLPCLGTFFGNLLTLQLFKSVVIQSQPKIACASTLECKLLILGVLYKQNHCKCWNNRADYNTLKFLSQTWNGPGGRPPSTLCHSCRLPSYGCKMLSLAGQRHSDQGCKCWRLVTSFCISMILSVSLLCLLEKNFWADSFLPVHSVFPACEPMRKIPSCPAQSKLSVFWPRVSEIKTLQKLQKDRKLAGDPIPTIPAW